MKEIIAGEKFNSKVQGGGGRGGLMVEFRVRDWDLMVSFEVPRKLNSMNALM